VRKQTEAFGPGDHQSGPIPDVRLVVDVRTKESEPAEDVSAVPRPGHVLLRPTATPPAISALDMPWSQRPIGHHAVYRSDSTACDNLVLDLAAGDRCWPEYFAPPIDVANYADSGESSSSFYGNSLLWGAIKSHWTAGDWVLIQFGHNDKGVADSTVRQTSRSM